MSDLEKEMSMIQNMDISGTATPVSEPQVVPVQATQTQAQPVGVTPQQAPVQTTTTSTPQTGTLNLDVAQQSTDENQFMTVEMGKKVSTAVMEKFKGQKDEKKRVAIFMPWFDIPGRENSAMAVKRHYNQDLGSFVCFGKECCQYEDKAVVRYLFPVIEYPISNNDATKPLPEEYGRCKLKLLVAGNELYSNLVDIYQAHSNGENAGSFDGFDLIMTCTEQQFQNFTVFDAKNTVRDAYKSFNECVEEWKAKRDQAYTVVARKMDPEYYRTQKGIGMGPVNTVPTDVPTMDAILQ